MSTESDHTETGHTETGHTETGSAPGPAPSVFTRRPVPRPSPTPPPGTPPTPSPTAPRHSDEQENVIFGPLRPPDARVRPYRYEKSAHPVADAVTDVFAAIPPLLPASPRRARRPGPPEARIPIAPPGTTRRRGTWSAPHPVYDPVPLSPPRPSPPRPSPPRPSPPQSAQPRPQAPPPRPVPPQSPPTREHPAALPASGWSPQRTDTTLGTTFPTPDRSQSEVSAVTFVRHSWIQAKRLMMNWGRDPLTMFQSTVYPALTLLMFSVVLGKSISGATGQDAVFGQVPMIALIGAVFGSLASGVALRSEANAGLLTRFWVMPTHRASGLTGRLIAEAVRIVITTVFIVLVGLALGFRFTRGWPAMVAFFGVPLLLGIGFATFVTALAVMAPKAPLVELLSLVATLLMFFNSGFVPTRAYPPWLQGFVGNQPLSTAIDTMKGLSFGGPVQEPLLHTTYWAVGMVVVFAYPAIRGYRKAAMSRG